jgi:hypothetical protein
MWYEIDMNWYGIWTLKVLGLAKKINFAQVAPLLQEDLYASQNQLTAVASLEILYPVCEQPSPECFSVMC